MKLRKLMAKDAELMLEWMHDDDVVEKLGTNFKEKTLLFFNNVRSLWSSVTFNDFKFNFLTFF